MQTALASVQAQPQSSRTGAYLSLLADALKTGSSNPALSSDLDLLLQNVLSTGLVVSRPVVAEFVKAIQGTAIEDVDVRKNTVTAALNTLQPHTVTYEEQVTALRLQLADLFELEEEWEQSARILMQIPLDSSHRVIPDMFKLQVYIRIVRLLLEEEDAVTAESYFNRATLIIHGCQDKTTQLTYKLSHARILDAQRKFNEAGHKYHDLSYVTDIDEEERLHALAAAVTCAILGPAGPQRARLLATLYRDERTQSLEQYPILSATFLDQIIRRNLVSEFEATLKPHQLAKLPAQRNMLKEDPGTLTDPSAKRGPETVLDRAIMEHNLLSASKIYSNITFAGLGALLSLTPAAAEAMARTMIGQGRLKASIDQVERLIAFDAAPKELEGAVSNVAKASALDDEEPEEAKAVSADETVKWDLGIRKTAQSVEDLAARCSILMASAVGA